MRRRESSLFLFILSVVLCAPAIARAEIHYGGKAYADPVDLGPLFPNAIVMQTASTCHIHAAVQLMEEACLARTGEKVKISEAYLIYRHIRGFMNLSTSALQLGPGYDSPFLIGFEGGSPKGALGRFKRGSVLTEAEFPVEFLVAAFKELKGRFPNQFKFPTSAIDDSLDNYVLAWAKKTKLRFHQNDDGGVILATNDKALKKCLKSSFEIEYDHFSLARGMELLAGKTPFICLQSNYQGPQGNEGDHAFVVAGYRHNASLDTDKKYVDGIEFMDRDSNFKDPQWGIPLTNESCDQGIFYLK